MKNLRVKWYVNFYENSLPPKSIGIEYKLSVPQTLGDQTWYFDCTNVPEELPSGYSVLEGELEDFIGRGLSQQNINQLNNK
jgi:hypothetical protein